MQRRPYLPAQLPEVDEVEVVALYGQIPDPDEYMAATTARPSTRVRGPEAQAIASAFRALPAGEEARCHIPPYCVRFSVAGRLLVGASICGECNNILGADERGNFSIEFDARSTAGRELFRLLDAATAALPPAPIPPPIDFGPD